MCYVYELQLEAEARRLGLAKHMMACIEAWVRILTTFKRLPLAQFGRNGRVHLSMHAMRDLLSV